MKVFIFDLDDTLFDTTGQLQESYENLSQISLYPDTKKILEQLSKNTEYELYLVTCGDSEIQQTKIDLLNIKSYFKQIYIVPTPSEKFHSFEIIRTHHKILNPENFIVVGDRLDSEILFGNQMNFTTIRVKQGKRKDEKPFNKNEAPDQEIGSVAELLGTIG